MGPGHAEAQGLRVCGVRDTGGRAAGAGTDERSDDRGEEHQGGRAAEQYAAGADRHRRDTGGGEELQ